MSWVKEARTQSETEYANRIVQNFNAKIAAGKENYQDFDQVTSDVDLGRFPYVVQLLGEHVDNSADMLYELANDRIKMNQLESLAERSPRDAIKQAQRLSQYIDYCELIPSANQGYVNHLLFCFLFEQAEFSLFLANHSLI